MPDIFFNDPELTTFRIHNKDGKLMSTVDAVDILQWVREARTKAERLSNPEDWFVHFQSQFHNKTAMKLTKSQSAVLINEAEQSFATVKKNGPKDTEHSEDSEETSSSQNETSTS